ncbi:MAG: hypothetical protein ACLQVM_27360 [Terriglobia bacterium]
MLSDRLVRMIEHHADELTRALVKNLQSNPRTASYHQLSWEAIHSRTYDVYKHLGLWLSSKAEEDIEAAYTGLGKRRKAEGVPLNEVVYALILTKYNLRDYIRAAGLVDSAVDLYQEQELHRLLGQFFDKATYYTVRAHEREAAFQKTAGGVKSAH